MGAPPDSSVSGENTGIWNNFQVEDPEVPHFTYSASHVFTFGNSNSVGATLCQCELYSSMLWSFTGILMRGYIDGLIIISPEQLSDAHFKAALEVVRGTGFGIPTKANGLVNPRLGEPTLY